VGCGWGGELVYLCERYRVRGVGLTLSPEQKSVADARVARYGVDAQILLCDWHDYDGQPFDAIYTDEVIVHFPDLAAFFDKAYQLLRPHGWMVNKEAHYTHAKYGELDRSGSYLDDIFGGGNVYRTLAEELTLVGAAGFEVQSLTQLPRAYYLQTFTHWLNNMDQHKGELEALAGADYYRQFRIYLKLAYRLLSGTNMTVDIVAARK
jgi:cyclopropane-fatty-acyl-phospholipid synthase